MSLPRLAPSIQKLFGGDLTASGNVAVFGSLAAGSPAYSLDPAVIQSLAEFGQGFTGGVVGNNSPTLQDFNGLILALSYNIASILQQGVPEWIATRDYYVGNIASDGAGNVYVSLTNANVGNALTDTNNWSPYGSTIKGSAVCRAWVEFDGINATAGASRIISSFNVASVAKNATGNYTINFATAMPSANYTFTGSCGSENAQAYGPGDDGIVVGNVSGQGNAVRSATQCRVFTRAAGSSTLVGSGCVSVQFFG